MPGQRRPIEGPLLDHPARRPCAAPCGRVCHSPYPVPMRVLVDATPVAPRLKGTGRFLLGLLGALPSAAPDDEFLAVTWPEGAPLLQGLSRVAVGSMRRQSGTRWEVI